MLKITYFLFYLYLSVLVHGEGEFLVLSSPKAFVFTGHDELPASIVNDVLLASLGFSVEHHSDWEGMEIKEPFSSAKPLFIFSFKGIGRLDPNHEGSYPLITDLENIDDIFDKISQKILARYPEKLQAVKIIIDDEMKRVSGNEITEFDIPVTKLIQSVNTSHVNNESDMIFIDELNKFQAVVNNILEEQHECGSCIFWITLPQMSQIIQIRDADSKDVLLNMLSNVAIKAEKVYKGKALVAAIIDGEENLSSRSKRQVPAEYTLKSLNVAEDYDEDFPVIFNIILWFSLILLFSLIAISMVIAGMDPGRDSIIYRMTSTRMKKDN